MTEDPILSQHIISTKAFGIDPVPEADRRAFAVIVASAHAGIVFSRSRRTSLSHRVGPSPLLPQDRSEEALSRARIPLHAFSEPDRLMARPTEAARVSHIASASRSWVNWHRTTLTDHDGRFQANHPVIVRAIGRIQSPTSLQLLLRGPLGFVWKYGLGWHAPQEQEQPLTIPPNELGKGGEWEKLAKILTGDLTIDLFDHLREFKRRPGPRIEKLRGAHSIVYRTRR